MLKRITILSLLIAINSFWVFADDCTVNWNMIGGNVFPVKNNQIEMSKEDLNIVIEEDFGSSSITAFVDVIYEFTNHGDDTEIKMGFPILTETVGDEYYGEDEIVNVDFAKKYKDALTDFKTWINDKEVKTKIHRGTLNDLHYSEIIKDNDYLVIFYTFDVSFKKDETIKIKHSYSYILGDHCSSNSSQIYFILKTANMWKGPIKDFKAAIKGIASWYLSYKNYSDETINTSLEKNTDLYKILLISPFGYKLEDNLIFWDLKNFQPEEDLIVQFSYKEIGSFHDSSAWVTDRIAKMDDEQLLLKHEIDSIKLLTDTSSYIIKTDNPYHLYAYDEPEVIKQKIVNTIIRLKNVFKSKISKDLSRDAKKAALILSGQISRNKALLIENEELNTLFGNYKEELRLQNK